MSSFCIAKATHIFSAKNFSIFAYHLINFNESLANDIVSFEQLGPGEQKTSPEDGVTPTKNSLEDGVTPAKNSLEDGVTPAKNSLEDGVTPVSIKNELNTKIHAKNIGLDKGGYPVNIFLISP